MKDIFTEGQEIYLDAEHRKLGGVCAGVANYLDVPRFWIRVAAVIGLIIHPPATLLAYGLAYVILEEQPQILTDYIRSKRERRSSYNDNF